MPNLSQIGHGVGTGAISNWLYEKLVKFVISGLLGATVFTNHGEIWFAVVYLGSHYPMPNLAVIG